MENFFMALADKTRLRILNLMRDEEVCVCYFTEILGEAQPKISRHLAYLRQAGLVETTREGKWIYYRILEPDDEDARQVLRSTLDWLTNEEQMRNDRDRLVMVCSGEEEMPVALRHVPKQLRLPKANVSLGAFASEVKNQKPQKQELADYLL